MSAFLFVSFCLVKKQALPLADPPSNESSQFVCRFSVPQIMKVNKARTLLRQTSPCGLPDEVDAQSPGGSYLKSSSKDFNVAYYHENILTAYFSKFFI
jgi:hypothetical protein